MSLGLPPSPSCPPDLPSGSMEPAPRLTAVSRAEPTRSVTGTSRQPTCRRDRRGVSQMSLRRFMSRMGRIAAREAGRDPRRLSLRWRAGMRWYYYGSVCRGMRRGESTVAVVAAASSPRRRPIKLAVVLERGGADAPTRCRGRPPRMPGGAPSPWLVDVWGSLPALGAENITAKLCRRHTMSGNVADTKPG